MTASPDLMGPKHPFYPQTIILPNSYIPNNLPQAKALFFFFVPLGLIAFRAYVAITRSELAIQGKARWIGGKGLCVWFVLCALIHTLFEGYYAYFHRTLASRGDVFASLWKEYALGDSRYITDDACVTAIEIITSCVVGPACAFVALCLANPDPSWDGYRMVTQLVISAFQFYGTIVYFLSSQLEGFVHSNPSNPFMYFYFYFFTLNFIWLVIPGASMLYVGREVLEAVSAANVALKKAEKEAKLSDEHTPKKPKLPATSRVEKPSRNLTKRHKN